MNEQQKLSEIAFKWNVSEYPVYDRDLKWYTGLGVFALIFIIYALLTGNFLFAIIILLFVFILIIREFYPPKDLDVIIDSKGVVIGPHYHPFKELKSFHIIYEPPESKYLYLSFKSLSPILSIELQNQNPIELRKFLINFVTEDLEKDEEELSDILSRAFKL